jgi:hypothetical protein
MFFFFRLSSLRGEEIKGEVIEVQNYKFNESSMHAYAMAI